jgi:hypothetical protein
MVSSGASPSKFAPYPVEVGTAITGWLKRPPATDGRTPSIPATTITTRLLRVVSTTSRNLWTPETPTSYISRTLLPVALRIAPASFATDISEVPAVMTGTAGKLFRGGYLPSTSEDASAS